MCPGHRVVVRAGSPERVEYLNATLWTYEECRLPAARLGSRRQPGDAADLADPSRGEPERRVMIVLVDGSEAEDLQSFARCADLFDGNGAEALEAARARWRRAARPGTI